MLGQNHPPGTKLTAFPPSSLNAFLQCLHASKTQAVCYAGLWHVSGNPSSADGDDDSTEGGPDYTIVAIAGAMYLLLTIAAVDLWGGCALCLEGVGSERFVLLTQRRAFGLCLLGTFVALIGASIRVLLNSSFKNADIVIGAAAVLFIADVVSSSSRADSATRCSTPVFQPATGIPKRR